MSLFSPDAEIIHSYRWLEERAGPAGADGSRGAVRHDATTNSQLPGADRARRAGPDGDYVDSQRRQRHVGRHVRARFDAAQADRPVRDVLMSEKSYRNDAQQAARWPIARTSCATPIWPKTPKDRTVADQSPRGGAGRYRLRRVHRRHQSTRSSRSSTRSEPKARRDLDGVTYTGLTPVVYMAERALLNGLVDSFFGAFVMMAVVMTHRVPQPAWPGF